MKIVYWSLTGNTKKAAEIIAEGIKKENKEVELINVSDASSDVFDNEDVVILGCPAMGSEVLEESEFDPFIDEISSKVSGKKVALFGSYGWGDGEWMRNWEDRMLSYGCQLPLDCMLIHETPDDNDQGLIEFGQNIAKL